MQGQMCAAEWKLIRQTVADMRPQTIVECGTWFGGGSTLQAAMALAENGCGKIHSFELDHMRYEYAVNGFADEYPELLPFVRLHYGDFFAGVDSLTPQLAILDGPENGPYTRYALDLCRHIGADAVILHDWNTPKCSVVRDSMEGSAWTLEASLQTETGMALLRRRTTFRWTTSHNSAGVISPVRTATRPA